MSKKKLTTVAEISGIISLVIALIFGINQWSGSENTNQDEKIIDLVKNYYDAAMRKDYEEIATFFDYPVVRFYDLNDASVNDIKRQQKKYYKKWKYQRINIVNNSIKIHHKDDQTKKVTLKLDYQTKRNESDKYLNFDLDIVVLFNSKNKIVSIYEMQN